ncbi:MAG: type I-D CRISPR-associated protein Cas7/Csc2 [Chloroflexota bacterium]
MLDTAFFHEALPPRPMGKYAHIVLLRETKGYALFQTDGELNRARVSAGVNSEDPITRITLFKRKQTTPERLNGRELLRSMSLMPEDCVYNENSCKQCADCITYGFAVGDGGSEKSKVYSDTAFSLTDYAVSHEVFTLNAPYEDGTMSKQGQVTSRINQQDHVKPQVFFPAVMTTRDLTANLFYYVLNNVMRTERYGATTTRGGTVKNHVVAVVLSDSEIFSNLLFTQRLYDAVQPEGTDPVRLSLAMRAANEVIPALLREDGVREYQLLMGDDLTAFLQSLREMPTEDVQGTLQQATTDCETYHAAYIKK